MSAIPDGFQTITPYIAVSDGEAAIALYEKALGAVVEGKMIMPGSDKIMHSCLQVGSSKLFLCDGAEHFPAPEGDAGGAHFYLYFEDVDAAHARAKEAGMTELQEPQDMFWGDRMSSLRCPYGMTWNLAARLREVSPEEMAEAMKQMGS